MTLPSAEKASFAGRKPSLPSGGHHRQISSKESTSSEEEKKLEKCNVAHSVACSTSRDIVTNHSLVGFALRNIALRSPK